MPNPLIVSIPHRLGKEEAVRRLKSGLGSVRSNFSQLLRLEAEIWNGEHLEFQVSALGQRAHGAIDVSDSHVQLEVHLPWALSFLAGAIQPAIRKEGTLLLEKKLS
jgi:hypothetical protein